MDAPAAQQVPGSGAQSTNPFVRDSVCERPPANAEAFDGRDPTDDSNGQADDFGLFRKGRKLCIRHEKMADRGINAQLQASLDALPLADRQAINGVWSTFSSSSHPRREIILKGLLTMCCFSQLSMLSAQTHELIRLDPFALFPREVSLKVLSFLDPLSLGKAVQVSRDWRELADDDILWRGMCAQHIERKCTKCGWGLPLLERKRLRLEIDGHYEESTPSSPAGPSNPHHHHHHHHDATASDSARMAHHHHHHHQHADSPHIPTVLSAGPVASGSNSSSPALVLPESASLTPNRRKRGTPDASASDSDEPGPSSKRRLTPLRSPSGSPPPPGTALLPLTAAAKAKAGGPCRTLTRPWKDVYTERLIIERNWRKGRYETKTLKGHSNSIMCLQVLESESWKGCDSKGKGRATNRAGPAGVLVTGSYDRTARVWDLESGEEVMVMRGHARGIRALQFDGAILITGSMDHTMRIWNWRTGACIRTLAGHTEGVICLNYDKNVLASGSADSTIKIWNFRDASCFTLRGHRDWVNSVVLWDSIAPSAAASSSSSSGATAVSPPPHASALPSTPNGGIDAGKMLFSGSDDGTIRLWDLNTRECVRVFEGHVGQVQSMKVLVVDRESREDEEAELGVHSGRPIPVPSETSYEPNALGIVGPPSHPLPSSAAHAPPPNPLGPNASTWRLPPQPDGDDKQVILVSASLDNTVRIWDIETGRSKKTFFGHIEGVWGVDADPLRVVSSSHDRTVKVWSRDDGKCTQTLVGHRSAVTCLQLTDTKIISGSDDGEVRLWDFGANPS